MGKNYCKNIKGTSNSYFTVEIRYLWELNRSDEIDFIVIDILCGLLLQNIFNEAWKFMSLSTYN